MGYARKSVLVAADNREMRLMLMELLRRLEFGRIDQSINAAQALRFSESLRYDCALVDLTHVGGLSLATVRSIRDMQGETTGILVLASRNTEENVRQAEIAGADALMAKPFSTASFAAMIERVLKRTPARPAETDEDVYV